MMFNMSKVLFFFFPTAIINLYEKTDELEKKHKSGIQRLVKSCQTLFWLLDVTEKRNLNIFSLALKNILELMYVSEEEKNLT